MRHIILHHHIFKNAGSTLDSALATQFGVGFASLENGGDPVPDSMVIDFLDAHPHIKAVSSHHIHGESLNPVLRNHGYRIFDLALVRRPMDRLLSVYKYIRRTPSALALWNQAMELDVRGFVQLLVDQHPYEIDNPQVNVIANHGFYGRPVSQEDLDTAWDRYKNYSLCAPVERYDEAMVTVEYFNSPVYLPHGLDLSYRRLNTSQPLAGEANLESLLGSALYQWLTRVLVHDERLWQRADAELDRRIALVPDFAKRLCAFQERCQRLQALAA
jgi:hypothetical protein